jgi:hypothetical protein
VQVLFHLPNIQQKILEFPAESFDQCFEQARHNSDIEKVEKIKMLKSRDLVKKLQMMFAGMLLANVKYQDPIEVLQSIVYDNGQEILIHE